MLKALTLILALLIYAAPVHAVDGGELLRKVDRNLAPPSYEMYRKLINIEPDGSKKEFVLFTVKKGKDSVAALFLSPASERGRGTLRVGLDRARSALRRASLKPHMGIVEIHYDPTQPSAPHATGTAIAILGMCAHGPHDRRARRASFRNHCSQAAPACLR